MISYSQCDVFHILNKNWSLAMPTAKIAEALEEIREGKMVILVDDEDRENEGDL